MVFNTQVVAAAEMEVVAVLRVVVNKAAEMVDTLLTASPRPQ